MSDVIHSLRRVLLLRNCDRCHRPLTLDEDNAQYRQPGAVCNDCFNGDNGEVAA